MNFFTKNLNRKTYFFSCVCVCGGGGGEGTRVSDFFTKIPILWGGEAGGNVGARVSEFFYKKSKSTKKVCFFFWGGGRGGERLE